MLRGFTLKSNALGMFLCCLNVFSILFFILGTGFSATSPQIAGLTRNCQEYLVVWNTIKHFA